MTPLCHRRRRGLTLLESIILLTVFSIASVGVSVGLQSAVKTTGVTDRYLAVSTELVSQAEQWRAVAFSGASWPASLPYSVTDTITLSQGGVTRTLSRTTTISQWDPNNIAGNASPQANFVRIQITIDGQTLTTYVCNLI